MIPGETSGQEGGGWGGEVLPLLLLDRRLCAAAAESTNPAFVQRNLANSGANGGKRGGKAKQGAGTKQGKQQGKQQQQQGKQQQGGSTGGGAGGGGGVGKVSTLRPRRLARALLQRRLFDHHPEVYGKSNTLTKR